MNNYEVIITRSYQVSVKARNIKDAKQYVEYFLDDCKDISTTNERENYRFEIETIKPVINEVIEIVKQV